MMSVILLLISVMLLLPDGLSADSTDMRRSDDWYRAEYPFVTFQGRLRTFETEFEWPRGFHRPDSASLSRFQFWASHFPLWHSDKEVSSLRRGKVYDADEVSRVVHLNWRVHRLYDYAIPVQILAEYLLWSGRERELSIKPIEGETLVYDDYLGGKIVYRLRKGVSIEKTEERDASDKELNMFLDFCIENSNYRSLASNCDSLDSERVAPGDLFIAHDEKGRTGRVWVVLNMLINDKNERIYAVGTGCPESCTFHIPLFNDNRQYPWITVEEIKALGRDFAHSGFFRLETDL